MATKAQTSLARTLLTYGQFRLLTILRLGVSAEPKTATGPPRPFPPRARYLLSQEVKAPLVRGVEVNAVG